MSPRRALHGSSLTISVNNGRCHLYGTCQYEAPSLFKLTEDERLRYVTEVIPEYADQARAAAMACPMRAIQLSGEQL